MWEIYAIGDGAFLEQVLIALALVTGSGDFASMVKIGIVLGILLLGFQAIMSGGRGINPGQLVIAWLVYGLAFGSTQTVTITDTYSQTVRPVDNVPVGVAAAGSILSSIGFQITELFETAFSTPTMTTQGYASSLETLKRIRLNTLSVFNLGRANAVQPGADFYRSWQQYIKECTLPGIETGLKTLDDIYRNPDLLTALRYDVGSNTTEIRIGGDPQTLECNAAHDLLAAFTTGTFLPDFKQNVLPHVLNLETPAGAAEVEAVITDALDGLGVGPSSGGIGVAAPVDADQFILTSVLVPIYYEAAKQRYQDDHKFAYATMVDDAIRARNAQWLANQSLFERFVRPMLTFLEGFLFAVIPVLALFIPIGMLGVRSAARFLLMVGWIQLWLPALAIVNLFLHDVVAGKLEGLDAAGMPITSMAGLFQADDVIQTWLATGGLMASAVPALTLMLVYGGAISANFLASRLRGDDVVAETQAAPRSFDPWVGTHIEPMSTYNPQVGAPVLTGGAGRLLSFNYSREGTALRESAYQAHSEQLEQFRDALSTGLHSTYGDDMRGVQGAMWNDRATAENNQALAFTYSSAGSVVDQIQARTGWNHQEALRFTVSGLVGLGTPGSGPATSGQSTAQSLLRSLSPLEARASGSLTDLDAKSEESGRMEIADRILREEIGDNEELRAGLITALAADIHEGGETSLFKTETFDSSRELASEASEALSSARHYEESIRDSTSAGSQISLSGDYAASLVAGSQPASRLLGNSIAAYGMVGEVGPCPDRC